MSRRVRANSRRSPPSCPVCNKLEASYVNDLKELCRDMGLRVSGSKRDLIRRIKYYCTCHYEKPRDGAKKSKRIPLSTDQRRERTEVLNAWYQLEHAPTQAGDIV